MSHDRGCWMCGVDRWYYPHCKYEDCPKHDEPVHKGMNKRGLNNLENVRKYFSTHLCATPKDAARALGVSIKTIHRYANILRLEWRNKK